MAAFHTASELARETQRAKHVTVTLMVAGGNKTLQYPYQKKKAQLQLLEAKKQKEVCLIVLSLTVHGSFPLEVFADL